MDIKEMIKQQEVFDESHDRLKHWNEKIGKHNLDILGFLLLATAGEVGEAANIAKKILRGDYTLEEKRAELSEEITDAFIYLLKLIRQLDIDIEKEFTDKMNKNAVKFANKDAL